MTLQAGKRGAFGGFGNTSNTGMDLARRALANAQLAREQASIRRQRAVAQNPYMAVKRFNPNPLANALSSVGKAYMSEEHQDKLDMKKAENEVKEWMEQNGIDPKTQRGEVLAKSAEVLRKYGRHGEAEKFESQAAAEAAAKREADLQERKVADTETRTGIMDEQLDIDRDKNKIAADKAAETARHNKALEGIKTEANSIDRAEANADKAYKEALAGKAEAVTELNRQLAKKAELESLKVDRQLKAAGFKMNEVPAAIAMPDKAYAERMGIDPNDTEAIQKSKADMERVYMMKSQKMNPIYKDSKKLATQVLAMIKNQKLDADEKGLVTTDKEENARAHAVAAHMISKAYQNPGVSLEENFRQAWADTQQSSSGGGQMNRGKSFDDLWNEG